MQMHSQARVHALKQTRILLTDTLLTLGEGPGEGSSTLCCSLSLTVGSSWRYNTNLCVCVKQTQKELVFAGLDPNSCTKEN